MLSEAQMSLPDGTLKRLQTYSLLVLSKFYHQLLSDLLLLSTPAITIYTELPPRSAWDYTATATAP